MEQEKLLQKIGTILNNLKIPYIITGGIAVVVWGRPRFTADIDIVAHITPEIVQLLVEKLRKIDKLIYVDYDMIKEAVYRKGEFNIIHPDSGLKVDFWILKNQPFHKQCIKRKVKKKLNKTAIYFISPEDLILSKLLWYKQAQSTRHLEDIESIIKIQKTLDWQYIRKWAAIQNTIKILKSSLMQI